MPPAAGRGLHPAGLPPGEEAQVDFFAATVELNGERRRVWTFLVRSMYSGRDFCWLYQGQDQLAFFNGHVRAFSPMHDSSEKSPQQALLKLSAADASNPALRVPMAKGEKSKCGPCPLLVGAQRYSHQALD